MENKNAEINLDLVSIESLDQMLKAHELKYIEKVIEVEEEQRIIDENTEDFNELTEEVQKKAVEEFPKAQGDPDYFEREGADKTLAKPIMILSNIENKTNELKVKNWEAGYRARMISKLKDLKELKSK